MALLHATLLALLVQGQGLPTSQPSFLTIIREQVKVGRSAEHARNEAGWPATFGRVNDPDYYLAMTSITGQPEAWYISPSASYAAYGASLTRYDKDSATTAALNRLSRADAEYLEGIRTVQAMARPDLSMGAYPDLAKQRFWEISVIRVRPGHEDEFAAAAKAYGSAAKRSAPGAQYRVYEVQAGMPTPTYIIFSSVVKYADFDQMLADGMKTMQAASDSEQAALRKFSTDALLSWETNRFQLDPKQSYVSRETRATDPAFWGPMPAPPAAKRP
ncbi:MAG TPA: hypothetical protein VH439_04240 [Gemmatimonadales bacterium]|jgi:hypothetical protein